MIYCAHFIPVGMKAFMDQTYVLSLKGIYFQKPVSEIIISLSLTAFHVLSVHCPEKNNTLLP